MPDVQPGPARVREHIKHVEFLFRGIETFVTGIGNMKDLALIPDGLPFWLDPVEWIRFAALAIH
jgi:hypothetical protein